MKRLYRSRKNRMIAGVCGGIAEYFDIDPTLVRIIAVLLFFAGGSALIAYIIGLIVIPDQPRQETSAAPASAPSALVAQASPIPEPSAHPLNPAALVLGILLIILGAVFLLHNLSIFDNFYWWFWHRFWDFFWPSIIIFFGLLMIILGFRKR